KLATWGVVAAMVCCVAKAEEPKCGLKPGDPIGMFIVEKVSGNPNDNVEVGKKLCYRCMLGNRPMVMVFARTPSKALVALVEALDAKVPRHADQKMAAFVNIIGSADTGELKATAKEFGEQHKPEHLAVVVPADAKDGPKEFGISPEADVTVIMLRDGKVGATRAFAADKLDEQGISAVIADTATILK
ncbi:MAG: hypothetical protein KJ052_17005, partial [Candidatus Hydrogenedentes bacterium]|nr:hypothetical protein [Candidatus Hydrogenedentota bacterium]